MQHTSQSDVITSTIQAQDNGNDPIMEKLLIRLCAGERVARFLQRVCAEKQVYVEVASAADTIISAYGELATNESKTKVGSAYVQFRDWPIASVRPT